MEQAGGCCELGVDGLRMVVGILVECLGRSSVAFATRASAVGFSGCLGDQGIAINDNR